MNSKRSIGFIGTGVMGGSMAGHLLAAGYPVMIHTRTRQKAEELLRRGAVWIDSIADLAAQSDIVISIVGFPQDVESVYLGDNGLVAHARSGACLVDMTTSCPELAQRIYYAARERGIHALDAPVSGGDIGAREARLTIMVGGDPGAFEEVRPLLEIMGKNVRLQGGPGAGQHTKMCNQIAIASGMMAICESMAYARKSGLDPQGVLESISAGAAGSWALDNLAPRLLREDFKPGFYVKHFLKDMSIALASAKKLNLKLPGLELAKQLYEQLEARGGGDLGTQALFKLYREPE